MGMGVRALRIEMPGCFKLMGTAASFLISQDHTLGGAGARLDWRMLEYK